MVQEPPQPPKIKLKVPNAEGASSSKKITIHVGGRSGSTDSQTAVQSGASQNGEALGGTAMARRNTASSTTANPFDKTRSVSVASPSPSARGKPIDVNPASPAPNGVVTAPHVQANGTANGIDAAPVQQVPPPPPPNPIWDQPLRAEGKGKSPTKATCLRLVIYTRSQPH